MLIYFILVEEEEGEGGGRRVSLSEEATRTGGAQKCVIRGGSGLALLLGTFSIRIFVGNGKPQTAKCHVTTALRSRLQFAVHV